VAVAIQILGGLGLFLFGMTVMGEGLQKVAGKRLRAAIRVMTSNRFAGIVTGFGVTAIVQSSSATTVMLVSFVNAGLMELQQAIGVIMGANIGTTVTGWLVALIGFKVKITMVALVAVGFGFFLKLMGKGWRPYAGEVLLGFGLIFIGLDFMKDATGDLKDSEMIVGWMSHLSVDGSLSLIVAVGVGAVVTMVIQSSSATMALTMTLAAQGLISFPTAAALILGENIGTTITANLAAIGASRNAKRAALAHMFFNVMGIVWMLIAFRHFIHFVDWIVPGDPTNALSIPGHMAAFHTLFNITNTLLFVPLVVPLAILVEKIIKRRRREPERLTYIDSGFIATPSLALESTRMELNNMAGNVITMIDDVQAILENPGTDPGARGADIVAIEDATDQQKEIITTFLRRVMQHATSEQEGIEVTRILAHVNDLERIGDHGKSILGLVNRIFQDDIPIPGQGHTDLLSMAKETRDFIALIQKGLTRPNHNIMDEAEVLEERIDQIRNEGRDHHQQRLIENSCDVMAGLIFLDMFVHFEKIGDHAYNIAQRVSGVR
jgi:phosphate:Na+ symporter